MRGNILEGGVPIRPRVCLPALAVLAAGLLTGCGGGSSTSSSPTVPSSPAAVSTQGAAASVDAVASVAGVAISKAGYEHWLSVENALSAGKNASHMALGFLITSEWVVGEAAAKGVSVSEAEVKKDLAQLEHKSFPKTGSLQKFLASSHESEADLLARIKVEMLESKVAAKVTSGKSGSQSKAALASFENSFKDRWKSHTTCKVAYVMEDCSEYKGKPEDLTAKSSTSSSSNSSSYTSSNNSPHFSTANSSGEVYTSPGAFSISSSAFERNGAIPAQYTCAGAGISPPLSWKKCPPKRQSWCCSSSMTTLQASLEESAG